MGGIALLLAGGTWSGIAWLIDYQTDITTGTVTEFQTDAKHNTNTANRPVVTFTTSTGQTLTTTGKPDLYYLNQLGDQVKVQYQRTNPAQAKILETGDNKAIRFILTLIGGILTGIFGSALYYLHWQIKHYVWLKQHGQTIATTFHSAPQFWLSWSAINTPFQIFSEWVDPQTKQKRCFVSNIIQNGALKNYTTKEPVLVYLNPNNPSDYYVDAEPFENLK